MNKTNNSRRSFVGKLSIILTIAYILFGVIWYLFDSERAKFIVITFAWIKVINSPATVLLLLLWYKISVIEINRLVDKIDISDFYKIKFLLEYKLVSDELSPSKKLNRIVDLIAALFISHQGFPTLAFSVLIARFIMEIGFFSIEILNKKLTRRINLNLSKLNFSVKDINKYVKGE